MKTAHFLKKDITTSQDLSADALSYTTSVGRKFKLEEIIIKASVDITETITITKISSSGANYSVILSSANLSSANSYVFRPEGQCNFLEDDELKVECTNANTTGIVYCVIKTSEM